MLIKKIWSINQNLPKWRKNAGDVDLKIIGIHQHPMKLERYIGQISRNLRFQFFIKMRILISKIENLGLISIIIRVIRDNIEHMSQIVI